MTTFESPNAADLVSIGAAVLNHVGVTMALGHTGPAESLSYLHSMSSDGPAGPAIVRDLVQWSAKRGDWHEAEHRLRRYVEGTGWQRDQLTSLCELTP